jgi:sterol 3beta-glucosyltransferase
MMAKSTLCQYNFSPAVVPPPLDWANSTTVSGYWNLASTSDAWQPPADLEAFIARARKQESKIAYIGFGSITIPNAHKTMQTIFDAAEQSGVFCVVSKGWSDRMEEPGSAAQKPWTIPDTVYLVDSIPHDWLFPRIDIAFHHGGAGTTGASLANKLVTLIHPFFGDQFFWANRVEKLGAGKRVVTLSMHDVKSALSHAAHNRLMMEKAVRVGEAIKLDRGVESARAFVSGLLVL